MTTCSIKLIGRNAKVPERATLGSVGYDICACLSEPVTVVPNETCLVGVGFAIALENSYAAFIYARSGLGINHGIIPANCVGVIDSDYRGEIKVGVKNTAAEPFTIHNGDRIAQMVITKCELPELKLCNTLDDTIRGEGGFGST